MRNDELLWEGLTAGEAREFLKKQGVTKRIDSANTLAVLYDALKRKEVQNENR